jgi:hypothetical protein
LEPQRRLDSPRLPLNDLQAPPGGKFPALTDYPCAFQVNRLNAYRRAFQEVRAPIKHRALGVFGKKWRLGNFADQESDRAQRGLEQFAEPGRDRRVARQHFDHDRQLARRHLLQERLRPSFLPAERHGAKHGFAPPASQLHGPKAKPLRISQKQRLNVVAFQQRGETLDRLALQPLGFPFRLVEHLIVDGANLVVIPQCPQRRLIAPPPAPAQADYPDA